MAIVAVEHVALPVAAMDTLLALHRRLGFPVVGEAAWRAGMPPLVAIRVGARTIDLHPPAPWRNPDATPRRPAARPGCGDLRFARDGDPASLQAMRAGAEAAARRRR
jgi:hypothetical protein